MVRQLKSIYNVHFISFGLSVLFLFLVIKTTYSATIAQPPDIGNFSLPSSQQPHPLFSFGQNIVNKGLAQFFLTPSYLHVVQEQYLTYAAQFVYGLSDSSAVLLKIPFAANYRDESNHSSGISDISFLVEHAFFNSSNLHYTEQATIVAEITAPTGSYHKEPPTGYGSPSYFIGGTYNQMFIDWYWFVSPGLTWISPKENIHLGTQYLYQFGIGRNIKSEKNQYILFGLVEFDGEFVERDKIMGHYDPDSGGNIVLVTPSISFATEKLIIQLGVSLPLIQQLNGDQNKINYDMVMQLTWTFK
jgi:hypothetical protein